MNLFLIGDLENYGVENKTVNFYLHEERDRWDFLVLRFHQFYILYSQYEDYNAEEAIVFLKKQQKVNCISGKTVLLEKIAAAFPQWKIESTYMSRCDPPKGSAEVCWEETEGLVVRPLEKEDVPEAVDLLSDIEEFAKTFRREERGEQIRRMEEEMTQGSKKAVGGFLDGRMVSVASISAENSESAMVVGVATISECRGKGYASAVVQALCLDCFRRGKSICACFMTTRRLGGYTTGLALRNWGSTGCCGDLWRMCLNKMISEDAYLAAEGRYREYTPIR